MISFTRPIYSAGIQYRHSSGSPFCGNRFCYMLPLLWTLISVILWIPTRHLSFVASPLFAILLSSAKEKSVGYQVLGFLVSLSPERTKKTEDRVISCCMLAMLLLSESFPQSSSHHHVTPALSCCFYYKYLLPFLAFVFVLPASVP